MNTYINELPCNITELSKKEILNLIYKIKKDIKVYSNEPNYDNFIEEISNLFVDTTFSKKIVKKILIMPEHKKRKKKRNFKYITICAFLFIIIVLIKIYYVNLIKYKKIYIEPFLNKYKKLDIDVHLTGFTNEPDTNGYYYYSINKILNTDEKLNNIELAKKAMYLIKEIMDIKWSTDSYIGVNYDYKAKNKLEEEAKEITNKEIGLRNYNKHLKFFEKRILDDNFPIYLGYIPNFIDWEKEFKENIKKLEHKYPKYMDVILSQYDTEPNNEGFYCYTIDKAKNYDKKISNIELAKKAMNLVKEKTDILWNTDSYIGVKYDYKTKNKLEEEAKEITNKDRSKRIYEKKLKWYEKEIVENKFPIKNCYRQGNAWEKEFKENLKKLEEQRIQEQKRLQEQRRREQKLEEQRIQEQKRLQEQRRRKQKLEEERLQESKRKLEEERRREQKLQEQKRKQEGSKRKHQELNLNNEHWKYIIYTEIGIIGFLLIFIWDFNKITLHLSIYLMLGLIIIGVCIDNFNNNILVDTLPLIVFIGIITCKWSFF